MIRVLRYDCKTCISKGKELYFFVEQSPATSQATVKNAVFPESLIAFLDLDLDALSPQFEKMEQDLCALTRTKDARYQQEIDRFLQTLPEKHLYFELFRLIWTYRIDRASILGFDFTDGILQRGELNGFAETLKTMQAQIQDLFANVLDADSGKDPVPQKMAAYYNAAMEDSRDVFQFRPQPLSFELLNRETFAEVLCPNSVLDIIDYHTRECVKREIRMRRCKNCGRWFAVTGHGGTEYCDRVCDSKGRTCKEVGAIHVWTESKRSDEVFQIYRREYKKRFAWIKAGRIEPDAFYAWSEQAREKKAACEAGTISLEEFTAWLKQ